MKLENEELIHFLEELKDKLLIVEGKNDEKALKVFGLKNIIALNGRPLQDVAQACKGEIVILTDFDREGKKLAKKLNFLLRSYKKKVNQRLRCKLMEFGKNRIEDFMSEGLASKESDVHVKISSNFNKICDKGFDKCRWSGGKA